MSVRVRHLRSRVRAPAGFAPPSLGPLGEALEVAVASVLAERGLPPDAEVVVRRARVRVRVRGAVTPADVAAGQARALADVLDRRLARVPVGGWDDELAVFPDRGAAAWAWLTIAAEAGGGPGEGSAVAWWGRIFGDAPSAGRVLAEEVAERPERVRAGVATLVARSPAGAARILDEAGEAARRRFAAAEAGNAGAGRGAQAGGAASGRAGRAEGGARSAGGSAWERAWRAARTEAGRRWVEDLGGAAVRPGSGALSGAAHDRGWGEGLGAVRSASSAESAPGSGATEEPGTMGEAALAPPHDAAPSVHADERISTAKPAVAAVRLSSVDAEETTEADARETARASAPVAHPADLARSLAPPLPTDRGEPVGTGGLLFLVRRLARMPDTPSADAHLDLARVLLWDLCSGMPPGARRRALAAETPVVTVFAGFEALDPDEWTDEPDAETRARAEPLLRALDTALPDDLAPPRGAVEWLLRATPLPPALARLGALVLRPGHLAFTRTHARLTLPIRFVDVGLRRAGWDLDPGWVPTLGRVIRFEYEDDRGV